MKVMRVGKIKRNQKGFTLVELIVVIAILAILVGVLAPQFLRYIDRARLARDTQLADRIRSAVLVAVVDPEAGTDTIPDPVLMKVANITVATSFGRSLAASLGITDFTDFDDQLQHRDSVWTWIEIKNGVVKILITNEAKMPNISNSNCNIIVG